MKKILSLVLAIVMIMAMAIPAFATGENEVAPCAICTGSHTPGTYQGYSNYWTYSSNTVCKYVQYKTYECSVCHKLYSVLVGSTSGTHTGPLVSASCNGNTQTWVYHCTKCGRNYTQPKACPHPGHVSGDCDWLPI